MLMAFFADLVVWFKADRINFDDEPAAVPPCVGLEQARPDGPQAIQYESTI